jgi:hypothetical protein
MLIDEYKGKKNHKFRRKGNIKYSANRYDNPFFIRKPGRKTKKRFNLKIAGKFKWGFGAFVIIIFSFFILSLYLPYFNIKNINIDGQGRVSQEDIKKIVDLELSKNYLLILSAKNIFVFNSELVSSTLNEKYALETLLVNKKFPNRLDIYYDEKNYAIIWQEGDSYYYVSAAGDIITEANLLEIKKRDYPIIENKSNKIVINKKLFLSESDIAYVLALFKEFKQYSEDFQVEKFLVNDDINTIIVKILEGPEIFFNPELSIEKQLTKLITIKNEKLGDKFKEKKEINLRIGDSVFIK